MSAFDYTRSRTSADRMIAKFGQAATIKRRTESGAVYNPTVTWASHAATVVVSTYRNQEVDGTRILTTDKKVILASLGLAIEPTTADKIVIGGVEHAIIRVEPVSPGGETVLYKVQARK